MDDLLRPLIAAFMCAASLSGGVGHAQSGIDLDRLRSDVAVLASEAFNGRGYHRGGHEQAALFVRDRFRETGLRPVGGSYLHPFALRADVFVTPPMLRINGTTSPLGSAYLPLSSTGDGCFPEAIETRAMAIDSVLATRPVADAFTPFVAISHPRDSAARFDSLRARSDTFVAYIDSLAMRGAVAALLPTESLSYAPLRSTLSLPVFEVMEDSMPDPLSRVSFCLSIVRDTTFRTQNVAGVVPGTDRPDSLLILGAHYDHLGRLSEDVYFPGANDNASGVALLMALADTIAARPLRYTTLFVAFSGEERGLAGSLHFVRHPPIPLYPSRLMINFDMVASGRSGVVTVGGSDFPDLFRRLSAINDRLGNRSLGKRKNVPNSDHYPFSLRGIPAFFLYTNEGAQPYHSPSDVPRTLDWEELVHVYRLTTAFLQTF